MGQGEDIKQSARIIISELEFDNETDSVRRRFNEIKVAIAKLAFWKPLAILGNCEEDGSELRFEIKNGGLYLCCSRTPSHCFRIK